MSSQLCATLSLSVSKRGLLKLTALLNSQSISPPWKRLQNNCSVWASYRSKEFCFRQTLRPQGSDTWFSGSPRTPFWRVRGVSIGKSHIQFLRKHFIPLCNLNFIQSVVWTFTSDCERHRKYNYSKKHNLCVHYHACACLHSTCTIAYSILFRLTHFIYIISINGKVVTLALK